MLLPQRRRHVELCRAFQIFSEFARSHKCSKEALDQGRLMDAFGCLEMDCSDVVQNQLNSLSSLIRSGHHHSETEPLCSCPIQLWRKSPRRLRAVCVAGPRAQTEDRRA